MLNWYVVEKSVQLYRLVGCSTVFVLSIKELNVICCQHVVNSKSLLTESLVSLFY